MKVTRIAALMFAGAVINAEADGFIDEWFGLATRSQFEQPHWIAPLVTVTPRLEQEVRFDYLQEHLSSGQNVYNYGNGKGLRSFPQKTPRCCLTFRHICSIKVRRGKTALAIYLQR